MIQRTQSMNSAVEPFSVFGFVGLAATAIACGSSGTPPTTHADTGTYVAPDSATSVADSASDQAVAISSVGDGSDGSAGLVDSSGVVNGLDASSSDGGSPTLLSEAGLYSNIVKGTLAPGVYSYHPQFALWADGATKSRWVKLPPGTQINTTDMDFWEYPIGTKLFKEFAVNGVRVETRIIFKRGADDFYFMAFQWNSAQTEAVAVPGGVVNAAGTPHDIPSQNDCQTCHETMHDRILGFSAVQLAHPLTGPTDPEVNLDKIASMGWLTKAPLTIAVPGNTKAQAALGYLHANCGGCHNPKSYIYLRKLSMDLWLQTNSGKLDTVKSTPTYMTLVDQPTTSAISALMYRIVPGQPGLSEVHELMSLRRGGPGDVDGSVAMRQMPPLATKVVDTSGLAEVDSWIAEVSSSSSDAAAGQ